MRDGLFIIPHLYIPAFPFKGKKVTPEQYILGGHLSLNAILIFHQIHR